MCQNRVSNFVGYSYLCVNLLKIDRNRLGSNRPNRSKRAGKVYENQCLHTSYFHIEGLPADARCYGSRWFQIAQVAALSLGPISLYESQPFWVIKNGGDWHGLTHSTQIWDPFFSSKKNMFQCKLKGPWFWGIPLLVVLVEKGKPPIGLPGAW